MFKLVDMSARRAAWRGFGSGVTAGLVLVAAMYGASAILGISPLPSLLQEPLLAFMPGFVFGFLIDTLQHAGKVIEEAGLVVAMVAGLGVLGGAWGWASHRWHQPRWAMGFAAAGWLVVAVVLLPFTGDGILGLNEGLTAPLTWALLFAVYGVVLQLGGDPASERAPEPDRLADPDRRRMLRWLPLGIGALSFGALALELGPRWYRAVFTPPGSGLSGISPEITPIPDFYVVSKNLVGDPVVVEQGWRLSLGGLVDTPLHLTLSDLRGMPSTSEYVTLECISNLVGGPQMSTGKFTGVRLRELIAMAGPQSKATDVGYKAVDGYSETLPLSLINGAPEILVAYALDDQPLPTAHGFPARILIPGHYGMKGPKWLQSIDLADHAEGGYWEQQGWDRNAVVKTTARIDVPSDSAVLKVGSITVAGVAFAGTRGIQAVEYSTDGGKSWAQVDFKQPLSELTWVTWQTTWSPHSEGSYTLQVRATDGTGSQQDPTKAMSYPSGASGYHTVRVDVSK